MSVNSSANPAKRQLRDGLISNGHVILANQGSILDAIFLIQSFSPRFVHLCTSGRRVGYRELGFFERFTAGLGIALPREVEDNRCLTLGQVMERN